MASLLMNKYKISRRGRKLQTSDDQRTLLALPKDIPERTWAEILQKEENDLFIFEIREDIIEETLKIGYERYMEKQTVLFTAHCAAQAWLKLIDWLVDDCLSYSRIILVIRNFFRHDPGEDPSAYPPCFIPKRTESWIPDELPEPSPKDTWCRHDLNVVEDTPEESLQKWPSNESLDLPVVGEIPSEYWYPGKVNVPEEQGEVETRVSVTEESSEIRSRSSEDLATQSEVLQKVTDYSPKELSVKESLYSALKTTTPVEGSLQGAGDSVVDRLRPKRRHSEKSKIFSKASVLGRSKNTLPPLDVGDSRSRISVISDCRLRNLRLDTQYEISSEKVDSPPGETMKRK